MCKVTVDAKAALGPRFWLQHLVLQLSLGMIIACHTAVVCTTLQKANKRCNALADLIAGADESSQVSV